MSDLPEEQIDTCRICSGPGEPNEPLFHPCKCSGTIRYIHQDCLTTWLQHSKKRSCDVCKTEYAFQKVYDPNMPSRLPPLMFAHRLALQVLHWQLFGLRAIVVAFVWLAFLPYTTVWVWRFYFWTGEVIAWKAFGESMPISEPPMTNSTSSNSTTDSSLPSPSYPFGLSFHIGELARDIWSDIFAGQIIASLIIVLFLAVFLLREWIVQNARPGVFGEPVALDGFEDPAPPELPREDLPEPPQPPPQPNGDAFDREAIALATRRARQRMEDRLALARLEERVAANRPPVSFVERKVLQIDSDEDTFVSPESQGIQWPTEERIQALPFPLTSAGANSSDHISSTDPTDARLDGGDLGDEHYIRHPDPAVELARIRMQRERYFAEVSGPVDSHFADQMVDSFSPISGATSSSGSKATSESTDSRMNANAPSPPYALKFSNPLRDNVHDPTGPPDHSLHLASLPAPILGPNHRVDASSPSQAPSSSSSPLEPHLIPLPLSRTPSETDLIHLHRRKTYIRNFDGPPRKEFDINEGIDISAWIEERGKDAFKFDIPVGWTLAPNDGDQGSQSEGTSRVDVPSENEPARLLSRPSSWDSWQYVGTRSSSSSPQAIPLRGEGAHLEPSKDLPTDTPSSLSSANQSVLLGRSSTDDLASQKPSRSAAGLPRRPHLPPTTPIDELPPPSPRPSHARPSPLPSSTRSSAFDSPSLPLAGPSRLRDVSNADNGVTIYRPPEELDPGTSYFATPQAEDPSSINAANSHLETSSSDAKGKGLQRRNSAPDLVGSVGEYERDNQKVKNDRETEDEVENVGPPRDPQEIPNVVVQEAPNGWDQQDVADRPARVRMPQGDAEGEGEEEAADPAEMAENVDDEMDGLLEAAGMRGPVLGIVQNVSLMIFILDMTIGAAVWLPFTLGKTLALNSMKPRRLLFVLHIPIRAVRLVTDPVVDGILWFLRPAISHLFRILTEVWKLRTSQAANSPVRLESIYNHVVQRVSKFVPILASSSVLTPAISSTSIIPKLLQLLPNAIPRKSALPSVSMDTSVLSLPSFIMVQSSAIARSVAIEWETIAKGNGPSEQAFAIVLGYIAVCGFAMLFLSSGVVFPGAARVVRSLITQQLIVVKVAVFIIIELVVFPFGCGVILDLSTLPVFPDASVWSRLQYCTNAPVTAAFFHWMLGTMFMYQFAMLLAACRGLMRKGALWFIKDPQDPTFHPIRDILERRTLSQLRKLGISALMYSFVIAGGVGVAMYSLCHLWTPFHALFPLRWDSRKPISEIPVDLLFMHIMVPLILDSIKPRDFITRATTAWWEHAAHELRLTSYMFGYRVVDEEEASVFTWRRLPYIRNLAWVVDNRDQGIRVRDGGFARGPAGDTVAFPDKERQMLVTTDEHGVPLDDEGRRLIEIQNEAATKANRNVAEDYQVVYLPPHFKYRVSAFIAYLWFTSVCCATVAVGSPILLGRFVLDLCMSRPIHDGYSFIVGGCIVWAVVMVGRSATYQYRHLQLQRRVYRLAAEARRSSGLPIDARWDPIFVALVRFMMWLGKVVWIGLALGLVLPILLAVMIQLYLILPIRVGFFPDTEGRAPTIHVWEDWSLGLVLASVSLRMARMQPPTAISRAWDTIVRNGFTDVDIFSATLDFIFPVGGGLLAMIVVPGIVPHVLSNILRIQLPEHVAIRAVYPAIFVAACVAYAIGRATALLEKWAQTVRDNEFLIDLRLQNLEPDGARTVPSIPSPTTATPDT